MIRWLMIENRFNCAWKRALKRVLPLQLQLEIRKRTSVAALANGANLEGDVEGVRRLVRPGDTVLDVGANIGVYTSLLSQLVGPTGRVLAFEPMPDNYAVLQYGVRRLSLENVRTFAVALSNTEGSAIMEVPCFAAYGESLYDSRIVERAAPGVRSLIVTTKPLDSFGIDRCAFLKLDTEGHELQVLQGAAETIRRCRPAIMIETFEPPADQRSASGQCIRLLTGEGYTPSIFQSGGFLPWDGYSHPQNLFFSLKALR